MKAFYLTKIREQMSKHGSKGDATHPTVRDLCSAVMAIENGTDAKTFFDGYVKVLSEVPEEKRNWDADRTAADVARSNIGWFFGEGMSPEKIKMWSEVTGASHPAFGISTPTPQEALEIGLKMGEKMRKAREE